MDDKNRFILIIVIGIGGLLLIVGGTAVVMHLSGQSQNWDDIEKIVENSWFNGSRYINTEENWAYIDLTFPPGYEGMEWNVKVYGIEEEFRTYIYSRGSQVNSSTNGVKLNLDHDQIKQFDCFDINVNVMNESQTEQVCIDEFEVRCKTLVCS
jgi:protein associated with RNAse G/E